MSQNNGDKLSSISLDMGGRESDSQCSGCPSSTDARCISISTAKTKSTIDVLISSYVIINYDNQQVASEIEIVMHVQTDEITPVIFMFDATVQKQPPFLAIGASVLWLWWPSSPYFYVLYVLLRFYVS